MRKKIFIGVVAGLFLVIWLLYSVFKYAPYFHVIFFDVGQADASLIFFEDGTKMLVDCGRNRAVLSKLGDYMPFFDRRLDYLVITHFDSDHYGGCAEVLKKYDVGRVFVNGNEKPDDQYWRTWKKYLDKEGATSAVPKTGETMNLGSAEIDFLVLPESLVALVKQTENNDSIVFKLTYASSSFLFMGDAETSFETAALDFFCEKNSVLGDVCPAFKADYIKVGHHGSDSSSAEEFLAAVKPKFAVVSVGPNSFGHPSLRVLKKLERVGAEIWRTDEMGDIIVK